MFVLVPRSAYQRCLLSHDNSHVDRFRATPAGEPTVPDLVRPGSIVRTSYGTGPYVVVRVGGPFFYVPSDPPFDRMNSRREPPADVESFAHYSLCMVRQPDFDADPRAKRLIADSWINEVVAVGGRLLMLFEANSDEVFVEGLDPRVERLTRPIPVQLDFFGGG